MLCCFFRFALVTQCYRENLVRCFYIRRSFDSLDLKTIWCGVAFVFFCEEKLFFLSCAVMISLEKLLWELWDNFEEAPNPTHPNHLWKMMLETPILPSQPWTVKIHSAAELVLCCDLWNKYATFMMTKDENSVCSRMKFVCLFLWASGGE